MAFITSVLDRLNACPIGDLRPLAIFVLGKLSGIDVDCPQGTVDPQTADAVAIVFAHALREGWSEAQLSDELTSLAVKTESAGILSDAFSECLSAHGDKVMGNRQVLVEGFLPRLTGLSWELSHRLGDRTSNPPEKSLPEFDLTFHTTAESVSFHLSVERAHDLLMKLQEMVREAEAVTQGV